MKYKAKLLLVYMMKKRLNLYKEKKQFSEIRFDVIEIYQIKEHYVVNHIKNAF